MVSKSNSSQRPGISGRPDSYCPEKMMPGAYPESPDTDKENYPDNEMDETRPAYTSRNITQTTEAPGTQTAAEATHSVEGVAAEVVHTVGHLLYDAEEMAKMSVPTSTGTHLSYSDPAESSTTHHPKRQTTHKLKDALRQVQGDETTTKSQGPSTTLAKVSPEDVPLSESFGNMKISDKPTTLPSSVHEEYYRFARDIDHNPLDSSDIVYEDEISFLGVSGRMAVPAGHEEEKRSLEAGDHASDCARGGYVPGDESKPVDRGYGEGDVAVGHGGVTYNRFGNGGILPGYPTPEGMAKLIFDRMTDDKLREAGVKDPTSTSMPAAISRSTNSSEGYPTSLPTQSTRNHRDKPGSGPSSGEERTVPCLDFRIIEERRESPDFEDGSSSAPGKLEATYKPVSSRNNQEGQNSTMPIIPKVIPRSTDSSGVSPITAPAEFMRDDRGVQGDDSGLEPLPEETSVYSLDKRIVKERRQGPVFKSGGPTAAGQYEATFQSYSSTSLLNREGGPGSSKETPVFEGGDQTTAGDSEATFQPVSSSTDRESTHNGRREKIPEYVIGPVETGTIGGYVGYLGKPISESEQKVAIEKARSELIGRK